MTKAQFQSLKPGDTILWRKKYLRTIISGPKWPAGGIQFAIRHRSWTGRAYTVYFYNDVKDKIQKAGKTRLPILKSEVEVLKASKFNVRKELARELKEAKALAKRMGRPLCSGFSRLKRLVR